MSRSYPGRPRDPQPVSRAGETALVALCTALLGLSLAALTGLGLASLVAGGGWVWPHGSATAVRALDGLLTGEPGRGLPPRQVGRLAAPAVIYVAVAVNELALLALIGFGWALAARWYRPGDARRGMATRAEAAEVLGTRRLRAARAILRPDLYGTPRADAERPTSGVTR